MARDLNPQCKKCRRANEKLFLKGDRCFGVKCAMVKRNFAPGVHGSKGPSRLSNYGLHLKEKQKLSRIYGILEKQLRKYFKEAIKNPSETGSKMVELLETRLDNVIFRLGLASSRNQARQFVSHDLFKVNNKKINVPSYRVKQGDIITFRKTTSLEKGVLANNLKNIDKKEAPEWLNWISAENKGQVINLPKGKDIEIGVDMRKVVEFYS